MRSATGQTVGQPEASAAKITICDLYRNPKQYAGKMVQFRASLLWSDAKHFWLDDFVPAQGCEAYMRVVSAFLNDISPKASFRFIQDDSWRQLIESLKSGKSVEALFIGQFDPYFVWREQKRFKVADNGPSKRQNNYDGRLVLLRVSDVVARPRPRK